MTALAEVTVLAPAQLVNANREAVREQLRAAIDGGASVVLDLRETIYIDAGCVGMLANVHRIAVGRHTTLSLANVTSELRALLGLMRLHEVLTIRGTA